MDGTGLGALLTPFRRLFGWFRGLSLPRKVLGTTGVLTLIVIVVALAIVPSGILGLALSDSATFEATPATPTNQTLADSGYELNTSKTVTIKQNISPAGQSRTIIVENPQRVYRNYITVQNETLTAGVFATASTPAITVAGDAQNPIAGMSHREILNEFQSNLDVGGDNVTFENVSTHDAVMLGTRTTVSEFRANISVGGEKRDFAIYVTSARTNGDIVIAIGAHPTAFADERVSVMRLIYSVEHQGN